MSDPARQLDQNEAEAKPSRRAALWHPLASRNFRLLWVGETISLLGDQFYLVALPWLTLQLTGSGLAIGTVLMAAAIPRAVFMLVGGAMTDRLSPRALMLGSNIVRAAVAALIAVLVAAGAIELWHLYATAVIFGLVDAFFFPAFTAMVPGLLDAERLRAGNSLVQGSAQLTTLLGPAPAGVLISVAGIAPAFGFDAATFLFSALMLWLIRVKTTAPEQPAEAGAARAAGLLSSIREGLRYATQDVAIRSILLMIAAINFSLMGPFFVGLAQLADKRFEGGSVAYGTMLSAWGAGALLGTLAAGAFGAVGRRGLLFVCVTGLLGIGASLLAIVPNVVVASAVIACMAVGGGFSNVGMIAWLQTRTEPQFLGRVMSVVMLAAVGLAPLSFAIAGALVDVNLALLFGASGAIVLLSAVVALASKAVRDID